MSKPYKTQREVAGLGTIDVQEIKLSPEESLRFHQMPKAGQKRWLQDAGLTADTYYCTLYDSFLFYLIGRIKNFT